MYTPKPKQWGLSSCPTRRSAVYSTGGMVSTSNPTATQIGVRILENGGNAMDAAIATAAALAVAEPTSTGLGGDAFFLLYNAADKKVVGMNGSGRASRQSTLERLRKLGHTAEQLDLTDVNTVTVPGAVALWADAVKQFGKLELATVLQGAIDIATNGVPISSITAAYWERGVPVLQKWGGKSPMLLNGETPPPPGHLWKNPDVAKTLKEIADKGKDGFYKGKIAEAIVAAIEKHGGVMTLEDLAEHTTELVEPLSAAYHGFDIHEIPPNCQGIVALIALNLLETFDFSNVKHNSPEHLHRIIEALRMGFADGKKYITDLRYAKENGDESAASLCAKLLSPEYTQQRRKLFDETKASAISAGNPESASETVLLVTADKWGNAVSMVNSNYHGFGTGLVPDGTGFTLQNRGANFVLREGHANCIAPGKRPYHTIIPAIITRKGEFFAAYGVMGGFMQPQGHVQVAMNLIDWGMDAQQAVDAARILINCKSCQAGCENEISPIHVEHPISEETCDKLRSLGHTINGPLANFEQRIEMGRGYAIVRMPGDDWLICGGCDGRGDSLALATL
eukprot:TRINITY_DN66617_c4_g3_i1.p1 TRINITY_DN66617_c4_g3~~TRINITY_DN66617_c4_g3_i1.p1  ORF type:complete len:567 (+),score=65.04 TRINITY_DN66617_c4_g3_i1:27-1727(+)